MDDDAKSNRRDAGGGDAPGADGIAGGADDDTIAAEIEAADDDAGTCAVRDDWESRSDGSSEGEGRSSQRVDIPAESDDSYTAEVDGHDASMAAAGAWDEEGGRVLYRKPAPPPDPPPPGRSRSIAMEADDTPSRQALPADRASIHTTNADAAWTTPSGSTKLTAVCRSVSRVDAALIFDFVGTTTADAAVRTCPDDPPPAVRS